MQKSISSSNRHKRRQGKLTVNGVILEKHEMSTVAFLLDLGKDIEMIPTSHTPKTKRPDCYMNGLAWEIKSPIKASRKTAERFFYCACKQSVNIIFDLRRIKGNEDIFVKILEACFRTSRKAKRMNIITKSGTLRTYQK